MDDFEKVLLHARGFLYAYAGIITFLSSIPIAPRLPEKKVSVAHKWQKRILAIYFLCLATGGISNFMGFPEAGKFAITYGATTSIIVYNFYISFYMIFRV